MKYVARIEDKNYQIDITEADGRLEVKLNGKPISVDFAQIKPPNFFSFLVDNISFDVEIIKNSESYWVNMNGRKYECFLEDEKISRLKDIAGFKKEILQEKELKTPMPGLVLAIEVKEGDLVKTGQGVAIIEAMKMENELKAKFDGKVKKVKVKPGQAVDKDEVLVVFE
ncbi:MAG: biotin/lipoyl-containing protein [candidate division Zixibacteria bacterium]|nr:biotin/lipoyl-containing protein [candidate division Zixibacteria bacterium]